jgi:hypothetical protein
VFLDRMFSPLNIPHAKFLRASVVIVSGLILNVSACSSSKAPTQPSDAEAKVQPSKKNQVKFKGGERFAADLAAGLTLEKSELCSELGLYDCQKTAHNISLGGVEPYLSTIYTPIAERTVASSNATERIALSACSIRTERDFEKPTEAVLFGELTKTLATKEAVMAVGNRLYQRLLARDATLQESAHLVSFYDDLKIAEKEPGRAFATYACFAVATSEEALFF